MSKSAFVGAMGPNTILKGTWKKYHPPVHPVIGSQTLVSAVYLTVYLVWPVNLFQLFSAMVWEDLENTKLVSHPWMIDALWMFEFPDNKF